MRFLPACMVAVMAASCGGVDAASQGPEDPRAVALAPSGTREAEEPVSGTIMGRVSNERVPNELARRAYVQVYDRYPIGGSAVTTLPVPVRVGSNGNFGIDVPPGRYWVGARLGTYFAIRGPIEVTSEGGPQDLLLAPDFMATDVITYRGPQGPELSSVTVVPANPETGRPLMRAVVSLTDGVERWRLTMQRGPYGSVRYYLGFPDSQRPVLHSDELTLTLRTDELNDVPHSRVLRVGSLSDAPRFLDASGRPNAELAPSADRTSGYEVRWLTPDDASFSLLCVLADGGSLVLSGCNESVTSPYTVDVSRLTAGHPYELSLTVGRAISTGDGTAFNIETVQTPLVVGW